MTKISKATKLQAVLEYLQGHDSLQALSQKYNISPTGFSMMVKAYQRHGPVIFTNPPKVTATFRIQLVRWVIQNHASYAQTGAHFGYLGSGQMHQWRKIYLQHGSDGLRSLAKGRPPMNKHQQIKAAKKSLKLNDQKRIAELEERVQELEVKNAILKELASMKRD